MTERDEKGRFVSQGPDNGFDEEEAEKMGKEHGSDNRWSGHRKRIMEKYGFDEEEEAKETAGEHSWQNHRKENLKRLGLWDEIEE